MAFLPRSPRLYLQLNILCKLQKCLLVSSQASPCRRYYLTSCTGALWKFQYLPSQSTCTCRSTLLQVYIHHQQARSYAKDRKLGKKNKGKRGTKSQVIVSSEELQQVVDYEKFCHQLDLTLASLKKEYVEQLSVRTNTGVFDNLAVETPEGSFPLIQLGQVVQKNPQLIVIIMTATPQYIPAVKDTILKSGMNLNPQQDGTSIFIPIPKVTREYREGLSKNAKVLCDTTKEKLRDIQNRVIRELKKSKDNFSSDLLYNVQEMIQSTTHEYSIKAEEMMATKQQELLGGK